MQTFKTTGVIVEIGEVKTVGASGFQKREIVVDTSTNNYKNPVKFTLTKDRVSLVKDFSIGNAVEVEFLVNGRRWDGPNGVAYFNDLVCWKLAHEGGASSTNGNPQNSPAGASVPVQSGKDSPDEELPF